MTPSHNSIETKIQAMMTPNTGGNSHGLDGILQILKVLDNPHEKLPSVVHVAGTNGKGSTLAFLQSILEQSGYDVHRFTSPHLIHYNERIVVAGNPITESDFLEALHRIHHAQKITGVHMGFFDILTVCAFLVFSECPADIVLLETGIGGRLDVTNVIADPVATVITPISYDHKDILGNTLTEIATEKAHIQKPNRPSLIAPQETESLDAILAYADAIQAKPYVCGQGWGFESLPDGGFEFLNIAFPKPSLWGDHQVMNGATAVATAMILKSEGFDDITTQTMQSGIANAQWKGRMQPITQGKIFDDVSQGTEIWLDGGHNESAGYAIAHMMQAQKEKAPKAQTVAMIAMGQGKDSRAFLNAIAPHIEKAYMVPVPDCDRLICPTTLTKQAQEQGINAVCCDSVQSALQAITKDFDTPHIFMVGSLYLAGYILQDNQS